MGKNKKTRKPYDSSLSKKHFGKNDKLFGQIKLIFMFSVVIIIGVLVISKINP